MSVYVDPIFPTPQGWGPGRRYRQACHLFGDTAGELFEMAKKLGLHRSWAQGGGGSGRMLHFDLTPGKRTQALAAGAVPLQGMAARRAISQKQKEARAEKEGKDKP